METAERAESNTVQRTVEKAKKTTIKIKEDVGQFIAHTPLFRMLTDKAKLYFSNPQAFNEEVTKFYNEATNSQGNKTISDIWKKTQDLFYMVRDALNNKYQELPKAKVAIGVAVLLYVILPADIVPDVLPVFGFADDVALIAWFMRHAAKEIEQYEQWQASQGQVQTTYNAAY